MPSTSSIFPSIPITLPSTSSIFPSQVLLGNALGSNDGSELGVLLGNALVDGSALSHQVKNGPYTPSISSILSSKISILSFTSSIFLSMLSTLPSTSLIFHSQVLLGNALGSNDGSELGVLLGNALVDGSELGDSTGIGKSRDW
eukprot:CAMPEP_0203742944 /NCGR_PEP_ID=MMETSP0092-20131115/59185_1 /ASSEMBLY_ACC=CAM_ASM_001090 /TAXON_ID=426623 /ORGANISM="Chaetoceros affinis, Strain CCMP159" /LENGTH=143 /DNA_ID=CAMNT_0050630219 /DNA_START=283 /DNA_END=712 /DNA_ORIENTATION=+